MGFNTRDFSGMFETVFELLSKWWGLVLVCLVVSIWITLYKWGPIFAFDSLLYFHLANKVIEGVFPHTNNFTPGYSFLIGLISVLFKVEKLTAAVILLCILFVIMNLILAHLLKELIDNKEFRFKEGIVFSFFIFTCWWSIMIVNKVHADALFYLFVLMIFYLVIMFFKSEKFIFFLLASIVSGLSVWIKYNGLIFFPFLLVAPILYFGFCRKVVFPQLTTLLIPLSFFLFKNINGGVINHLTINERQTIVWEYPASLEVLVTNLKDTGFALLSIFTTDLLASKSPLAILMIFSMLFLIFSALYVFKNFGSLNLNSVLLSFSVLYILALGFLQQISLSEEMNPRTLFPPILILTIIFLKYCLDNSDKFFVKLFLVFFIFFNLTRSYAGVLDWYRRAPMDSFENLETFAQKPVLKKMEEVLAKLNLSSLDIYTNNSKYLIAYLDYDWVRNFPSKTEFLRGRTRPIDDDTFLLKQSKMINELKLGKRIIVLFDINDTDIEFLKIDGIEIQRNGRDYLIFNDL